MLSLVIALTLSADVARTPVGVAPTSRRPGVEKLGPKVAARVAELLISESIDPVLDVTTTGQRLKKAGIADPTTCAAGQQCALRLAALLGPHAVLVSVDVSKFGPSLDIRVEALAADATTPIASADLSVDAAKWKELSNSSLMAFAKELKTKLVVKSEPPPPPLVVDKPVEPVLTPKDPEPAPQVVTAPSRRPVGIGLAVGAGVAAVVAGVLLVAALGDKATFDASLISTDDGRRLSSLPPMQGALLTQSLNVKLTGALVAGLVALAAGGASVPFFLPQSN
ncbi:MAG: hypothetical protein GQE15_31590 [Archangiaceae bacterium]|nr:hypothetical protein [Archangiaceae bacterium]